MQLQLIGNACLVTLAACCGGDRGGFHHRAPTLLGTLLDDHSAP